MIGTLYSNISYSQQSISSSFQNSAASGKSPEAASQDTVLNRLASNIPGMSVDDMKSLSADEFTPEKVANRIGDFVAQGLEAARKSGRSEEDIQKLYNAAVEGVQRGMAEAREILDGLDMLSGSIADNIDKTEELTMDKLAGLNPAGIQGADSPSQVSRLLGAERYQEAETLSLKVKTQDGDEVTINFARQSQYDSSFGVESDGQGNSSALFNVSRSESSSYQFSVEGNLDEDEIDALQNLIKDVSEISEEFFDGDIQEAFELASEYRMDKTELASMNLQLTQSEQYTSVAKYQAVENFERPAEGPGKRLGHMLQNLNDVSSRPQLGFLENTASVTEQILSTLVTQDIRYIKSDEPQQQRYDENLESIQDLLSGFTNRFVQEDDDD